MSINYILPFFRVLYRVLLLAVVALCFSCEKLEEDWSAPGNGAVNIIMTGIEDQVATLGGESGHASASGQRGRAIKASPQHLNLTTSGGCSVEAVLSPISQPSALPATSPVSGESKAAATPQRQELATGTRFKVLVYSSNGQLVREKDFTYKGPSTGDTLAIDAGKTYTFLAYSIGTDGTLPTAVGKENLSSVKLTSVSGDLMYFSKTMEVTHGTNNLSVVLRHQFSKVTTHLTMDANMTGRITQLTGPTFRPTHSSADFALADGDITYNALRPSGTPVSFPALGLGERSVTSTPTLLISPQTKTATLNFGQLTIDGETKQNLSIPGLKITPGYRYNLHLNFKTCTEGVSGASGLDWVFPVAIQNGRYGILKDGKFYGRGDLIFMDFVSPGADYGYVFDVTELDNAFNMELNGVKLAQQEIQFEVGAASAQNIRFKDGSLFQGKNVESSTNVPAIYNMRGTAANPLVKIVISRTGEVTMFASKRSGGPLYELELFNGNSFNTFKWNTGSTDNKVRVSQLVDARTVLKGTGSGRRKIPCPK